MEVEWKNDGRTAVINDWWFHFDEMYAIRSRPPPGYCSRMTLIQKYVDSHEVGGIKEDDLWMAQNSPVNMRRMCGYTEKDWDGNDVWYAFFLPPEHHFNDVLQEAYQTYLLEKALRS